MPSRLLFFLTVMIVSCHAWAQKEAIGVPNVQAADFAPVSSLLSSETDAVVLLDSGSTVLDANPKLGFHTVFHRFNRLLILNKRFLKDADAGTFSLKYAIEINGKKLKSLKAFTYNLENGQVIKTAVEDKDIFLEDQKDEYVKLKFAFPNLHVGSIIEYEFTMNSYATQPWDWYFQSRYYPVLKSVYKAVIPNIWNFAITVQNTKYGTGLKKDSVVKTIYSWQFNYDDITVHSRTWTFENIPPMVEEPYTSTIYNYIGCIKFQLSIRPLKPGESQRVMNDWPWVSSRLVNAPDFSAPIQNPDGWFKRMARTVVSDDDLDILKARKIYALVRDHLKSTGRNWGISEYPSLEGIYKSGNANVAEINMILIAMLRSEKLQADPVILATRDNGFVNVDYPILDNYNYTICRFASGDKIYYLDASDPTMGFGKLPTQCYNGAARVITKNNYAVYLSPDSVRESGSTYAIIEADTSSNLLMIDCTVKAGYYESSKIRTDLKEKKLNGYLKSIEGKKMPKGKIDSITLSGVDDPDKCVTMNYKMTLDPGKDGYFYFNPLLSSGMTENPFKPAERTYPVEFSYRMDNVFVLNMDIPTGYDVAEMPKSERVHLNEKDGSFEYLIQKNEHSIQLKSVININKATFDPEDYNTLKEFYAEIIKKQSEMIVFKKSGAK